MSYKLFCYVNTHKVMILAVEKSLCKVFAFGFFYSSNFLDDYAHPGLLHIGFRVSDMIAA